MRHGADTSRTGGTRSGRQRTSRRSRWSVASRDVRGSGKFYARMKINSGIAIQYRLASLLPITAQSAPPETVTAATAAAEAMAMALVFSVDAVWKWFVSVRGGVTAPRMKRIKAWWPSFHTMSRPWAA